MNFSCKTLSAGALVSALFFTAVPLSSARTVTANANRCEHLAGRERDRCQYVVEHAGRLRVRAATRSEIRRNNTLRDKRVIRTNTSTSNIRRIGDYNLQRLRQHSQDGGNSRRLINRRDEAARSACEDLEGTAQALCVRANWRALSRGNTR